MEQTDLREAFFAEAKTNPYLHMITHQVAMYWAYGYEQALRDHGQDEALLEQTHDDRFRLAMEWITEDRRKHHVQALMALATLGPVYDRWLADELRKRP